VHAPMLFSLLAGPAKEYPYSITPGGVKADFYAKKDFSASIDFRFADEIWWARATIRKERGLPRKAGGRGAETTSQRCSEQRHCRRRWDFWFRSRTRPSFRKLP
jgi:hypothetical protein